MMRRYTGIPAITAMSTEIKAVRVAVADSVVVVDTVAEGDAVEAAVVEAVGCGKIQLIERQVTFLNASNVAVQAIFLTIVTKVKIRKKRRKRVRP